MTNRGWEEDLRDITMRDIDTLVQKDPEYGSSWKMRGGQGAFLQGVARKWDRLENQVKRHGYDIFAALKADTREEGIIDDIRDLRRYLLLIEAEMMSWGIEYDAVNKCLVRGRTEHPAPFGYQDETEAAE